MNSPLTKLLLREQPRMITIPVGGRPPIEDKLKVRTSSIGLYNPEWADLQERASNAGLSISRYIARELALEGFQE